LLVEEFVCFSSVSPGKYRGNNSSDPYHIHLNPSFLSLGATAHVRVSFGLLNNQPPFLPLLYCSDDETSNGRVKK
jgi:hypothetical protein